MKNNFFTKEVVLNYKKIFKSAWKHLKRFIKDAWKNIEATIVLTLSAIGLASLLSQIPYHIEVSFFINPNVAISAIAVIIIGFLITRMEKKAKRWKV